MTCPLRHVDPTKNKYVTTLLRGDLDSYIVSYKLLHVVFIILVFIQKFPSIATSGPLNFGFIFIITVDHLKLRFETKTWYEGYFLKCLESQLIACMCDTSIFA